MKRRAGGARRGDGSIQILPATHGRSSAAHPATYRAHRPAPGAKALAFPAPGPRTPFRQRRCIASPARLPPPLPETRSGQGGWCLILTHFLRMFLTGLLAEGRAYEAHIGVDNTTFNGRGLFYPSPCSITLVHLSRRRRLNALRCAHSRVLKCFPARARPTVVLKKNLSLKESNTQVFVTQKCLEHATPCVFGSS